MNSRQLTLSSEESDRMLITLSVYAVMCHEQNRSSLCCLIRSLKKTDATPEEILTRLFEGEDETTQARVQALCEAGHERLERLGALRTQTTGKKKRLVLSRPEQYRLAVSIQLQVNTLYSMMPSRKATYAALAEQSLELFGYELTAAQIEQRYRTIIKQESIDRYSIGNGQTSRTHLDS